MSIRKEIASMERTFKDYTGHWFKRPICQTFINEVTYRGEFPTVREIMDSCGNVPYENVVLNYSEDADAYYLTMHTKSNDLKYHSELSAEIAVLFGVDDAT